MLLNLMKKLKPVYIKTVSIYTGSNVFCKGFKCDLCLCIELLPSEYSLEWWMLENNLQDTHECPHKVKYK